MGQEYNFFWHYILDMHNNYVEDPRFLKVNPLSHLRMSNISEKTLSDAMKNINLK